MIETELSSKRNLKLSEKRQSLFYKCMKTRKFQYHNGKKEKKSGRKSLFWAHFIQTFNYKVYFKKNEIVAFYSEKKHGMTILDSIARKNSVKSRSKRWLHFATF